MSEVKLENNTLKVANLLQDKAIQFLYEAGGEIQAQTQRNTRVDTGQLKSSWKYVVDENNMKVTIGSPLENAIWEEFGTGEYAVEGNGRKTPWRYQDEEDNWHYTKGKKPSRAFKNAVEKTMPKIEKRLKQLMGD